jgi:hypothetical protein
MSVETSKRFAFNNHPDELYQLTMTIIAHVSQAIDVNDEAVFKLKMVLIELLTNSIKHTGKAGSDIEVTLTGDEIIIIKADSGNPFEISAGTEKIAWPVPKEFLNKTIDMYGDLTGMLKARLDDDCRVSFFVKEANLLDADSKLINNLTEHFGLLIITRACERFEYVFDTEKATNKFIATITTKKT